MKMHLHLTILFILLLYCCPVFLKTCPDVANYEKTKRNTSRLTSIYDGNFTIQTLITMTEEDSNDCNAVSREGVVLAYALEYAIDQFNDDPNYAKYAKLGLQIDDVCRKLPTTMARGIEVIYFHRPNSVCRADFLKCDAVSSNDDVKAKKASGVIGTGMSFTTIPLASLMSLYSIPHVSPMASSRLLSKKELYKSFFRTIPSDSNQIQAMLKIFKAMDWNYIFAIGSDDDYGKLGVIELKEKAVSKDICVTKDEYIPFQSSKTDEKVASVIEKIKNEPKAKVVVLFLYVVGLGDKILKKAQEEGVHRLWFTSETWNPVAAIEFSKSKYISNTSKTNILPQTHGILSVSLKKYPMQHLVDYIEKEIKENWECNLWLKNYLLHSHFKCEIARLENNMKFVCKDNKTIQLTHLMEDLKKLPGNPDRVIDAAASIGHAIHKAIRRECGNEPCLIENLPTKKITEQMFKTHFYNKQGELVSFNDKGNPQTAHYSIENLVYNSTSNELEYITVGNWSFNSSSGNDFLHLDKDMIQWPSWFNGSHKKTDGSGAWMNVSYPTSICSDRCQKGYKYVGKSTGKCCWKCHKCTGNNYTNKIMSKECIPCGSYHFTDNNIDCIKTPVRWLEIDDPAGLSVVVISALGLLCSFGIIIFMYRFWPLVTVHEKSPHLLTFICILLVVTFAYGPLHVFEPNEQFCSIRNGYFFVMLMIYTSFVLTKTQAMCGNIQSYCDKIFCGNMTATQFVVLFLFALLEIASIVAWIFLDEKQTREFRTIERLIEIQCEVEFTAARLVSTFIPCIILIIATFCSFRERNADHSFYEPKFLSFSCIALCIVIVAFLPTFKYVDGIYKAVVLAFTMNVFGFTFIACFILPKIYVGIIRKKRGIDEYPMKPGITKKEKKEQKQKKKAEKEAKKKKKMEESGKAPVTRNMSSSFKTNNTVEESISDMQSRDTETALDAVKIEEKTGEEKIVNAYSNETFEVEEENVYEDVKTGDVENGNVIYEEVKAADGSPPPSYESSMLKNNDGNPEC